MGITTMGIRFFSPLSASNCTSEAVAPVYTHASRPIIVGHDCDDSASAVFATQFNSARAISGFYRLCMRKVPMFVGPSEMLNLQFLSSLFSCQGILKSPLMRIFTRKWAIS